MQVVIDEDLRTGQCLELYTYASGNLGYAVVYDREWFYWPSSCTRNISALQLFSFVAAVEGWVMTWVNKTVFCH